MAAAGLLVLGPGPALADECQRFFFDDPGPSRESHVAELDIPDTDLKLSFQFGLNSLHTENALIPGPARDCGMASSASVLQDQVPMGFGGTTDVGAGEHPFDEEPSRSGHRSGSVLTISGDVNGSLGVNLAYGFASEAAAWDRDQTARRWRAWRGGIDVDLGEVFAAGTSPGMLPDRLLVHVDDESVKMIGRGRADPIDAPRERESGLSVKLKWLRGAEDTTLKVSTTKYSDELSREVTRRVQLKRSIKGDIWELSLKAGIFQTSIRDATALSSDFGYALGFDVDLWPGGLQSFAAHMTADLVSVGGGPDLDDLSTLFVYRIRF